MSGIVRENSGQAEAGVGGEWARGQDGNEASHCAKRTRLVLLA